MLVTRALLVYWENYQRKSFGPMLRKTGQSMINMGKRIYGDLYNDDRRNNTIYNNSCSISALRPYISNHFS